MRHLIDLQPMAAVAEARETGDRDYAVERLDRYLRSALLDFLQNRKGDRNELGNALLAARQWALRDKLELFGNRWSFLLELLEDSRQIPARAEQHALLTDRESSILRELVRTAVLAEAACDLRPKDLAGILKTSEQNVNNYLRRLENQGLLVRHRAPGQRAVVVFPTRLGLELAHQLKLTTNKPTQEAPSEAEPAEAALLELEEPTKAAKILPWPGIAA